MIAFLLLSFYWHTHLFPLSLSLSVLLTQLSWQMFEQKHMSQSFKRDIDRIRPRRCTSRHPFCPDRIWSLEVHREDLIHPPGETSMHPDPIHTTPTGRPTETVEKRSVAGVWDGHWDAGKETSPGEAPWNPKPFPNPFHPLIFPKTVFLFEFGRKTETTSLEEKSTTGMRSLTSHWLSGNTNRYQADIQQLAVTLCVSVVRLHSSLSLFLHVSPVQSVPFSLFRSLFWLKVKVQCRQFACQSLTQYFLFDSRKDYFF